MNESFSLPEALYERRTRYTERFGPLHPMISELSPQLLFVILEMALANEVEVDAASIDRALGEVDDRVAFFKEHVRA